MNKVMAKDLKNDIDFFEKQSTKGSDQEVEKPANPSPPSGNGGEHEGESEIAVDKQNC